MSGRYTIKLWGAKCLSVSGWVLIISIGLLVLGLEVGRLSIPLLVARNGDLIEHELSAIVGRPLDIGSIQAKWEGRTPRIELKDVTIYDQARHRVQLIIESAYLSIDFIQSLLNADIRLKALNLTGIELTAIHRKDGAVVLQGLDAMGAVKGSKADLSLLASVSQTTVNLVNSKVRFKDELSRADYTFDEVNISILNNYQRHRVAASLTLPDTVGQELTLALDFYGTLEEPAKWHGKLYINARGVRPATLLPEDVFRRCLDTRGGVVNVESWSQWRQGRPERITGRFSINGISYLSPRTATDVLRPYPRTIDHIEARFLWQTEQHGWRLRLAKVGVTVDDRHWPETNVKLNYKHRGNGPSRIRGTLSYLSLRDVYPLIRNCPWLHHREADWINKLSPTGELSNFQFIGHLKRGELNSYRMATQFHDIEVSPINGFPRITGLDGEISLSPHNGRANLTTQALQLEESSNFTNILPVDTLHGTIRWNHDIASTVISTDNLYLRNSEVVIKGQGTLTLDTGSPRLNAQLSFNTGEIKHISRYLPKKLVSPEVYAWFKSSLDTTRLESGRLIFEGRVADFPFHKASGRFEAHALVSVDTLAYKADWPVLHDMKAQVVLQGAAMRLLQGSARVLNSKLERMGGYIENLRRAALHLEAEVAGPMSDIATLLDYTPQPTGRYGVIEDLSITGKGRVALTWDVPVSKVIKKPAEISGELLSEHTAFHLAAFDLNFDAIKGNFRLGQEGVSSGRIDAIFRGYPVTIGIRPSGKQSIVVEMRGRVAINRLFRTKPRSLNKHISGEADWLIRTIIHGPDAKQWGKEADIELWSGLEGVQIDLPQPFNKSRNETRTLSMTAKIAGDDPYSIQINYGQQVSAVMRLEHSNNSFQLSKGEIRFHLGKSTLPAQGLRVRGRVERVYWRQWWPWLRSVMGYLESRELDSITTAKRSVSIDLSVGELQLFGMRLNEVKLTAKQLRHAWRISVDSTDLKGEFVVPMDYESGIPLVMEMEYLKLNGNFAAVESLDVVPRNLPALRIRCHKLQVKNQTFNNVHLETTRLPDGLQIHTLQLDTYKASWRAAGDWRVKPVQGQQSNLRLTMESADLGKALDTIGIKNSFKGGQAKLVAHLGWSGIPFKIGYDGLSGRVHVSINKGRLRQIEPGPGRVLGLVNVGALTRRLVLDFSDLFKAGFSFDQIRGNLTIAGADVYTHDLKIKGPSADLAFVGRSGLDVKDYDQFVTVTPKISTGVTVAGALLGGVVVGAAIFVGDKIIEGLGMGIDEATQIQYRITGSWEHPVVKMIRPPSQKNFSVLEDDYN
jgi:uncharacterized protein (TIGR02099 family)